MSATAHLHNRKRVSSKFLWSAIGGVLLMLGVLPLLTFLIWSRGHTQRVNSFLAKITAAGQPVSGNDLAASFPLEKGVEDVTKLWVEGLDAVVQPQSSDISKCVPFIGTATWEHVPKDGADFPEFAVAKKYLASNQFSLQKFHEAGDRGGYGRFSVDFSKGYSTMLPYTQNQRSAARLLRLEFELKIRQGDVPGAARSMKTLLVTSRPLEHEPTIVSQLVVNAIDNVAMAALAERLCVTPYSDDDLRDFQRLIRTKSPAKQLQVGLLGERAMGYSVMQDPSLMGTDRPPISPLPSDVACFLEFMERHIAASQSGFPEAMKLEQKIDDDLHRLIGSPTTRMTIVYTSLMLPAIGAATEAAARSTANLEAVDAAIAVELYRRKQGALPKSLTELVPAYLPAEPIDPHSAKPLIFKVTETGFAIYGVGKNGADDGGQFEKVEDAGYFFPTKTTP